MHGQTVKQINNLKINKVKGDSNSPVHYEIYTLDGQLLQSCKTLAVAEDMCKNCKMFIRNKPSVISRCQDFWSKLMVSNLGELNQRTNTYYIVDSTTIGGSDDSWSEDGYRYIVTWENKDNKNDSDDDIVLQYEYVDRGDAARGKYDNGYKKVLGSLLKDGESKLIQKITYIVNVTNSYSSRLEELDIEIEKLEQEKKALKARMEAFKKGNLS